MMTDKKETLEFVVPIYNEEECINELVERLLKVGETLSQWLHVGYIFVNDGSKDGSLKLLQKHADTHPEIRLISFSRNFGHQMAVTAGLDYSTADYVAIIDADLQDPPELVKDMYMKAREEGLDIVYGQRLTREGETFFKKFTAKAFYRIINKMCDLEIPKDTGDFRLINRKVVDSFRRMREQHRFIRGMVPWLGFKSAPFHFQRKERYAGDTKYPLKKMILFAMNGILSFSNKPLRAGAILGSITVGLGCLGGLLMLYLKFFTATNVPGITATILTVIIMGGIQIIMLGIIGEYIGKIFEEVKGRPLYVVEETRNIPTETPQ